MKDLDIITIETQLGIDLITSEKDKKIISEVGLFQKDLTQPISEIQVDKLVLNDIEFPTDYAKIKQIKAELITRYHSIIDTYYTIKKKELELELLDEEASAEQHSIKKRLKFLEKEKAMLGLMAEKSRLDLILQELRTYYKYYLKYNNVAFENLTDETKRPLEEELWKRKALLNPVVFEERYGEFIKELLGDKRYADYLARRKSTVGNFARELIP